MHRAILLKVFDILCQLFKFCLARSEGQIFHKIVTGLMTFTWMHSFYRRAPIVTNYRPPFTSVIGTLDKHMHSLVEIPPPYRLGELSKVIYLERVNQAGTLNNGAVLIADTRIILGCLSKYRESGPFGKLIFLVWR